MDYIRPDLFEVDVVAKYKVKEGKENCRVECKETRTHESVKSRRKTVARVVVPPTIPGKQFIHDDHHKDQENPRPVAGPKHCHQLPKLTSDRFSCHGNKLGQELIWLY